MAQFDVHRNKGKRHDEIPYVVIIQSSQFDEYDRCILLPLVKASVFGKLRTRFNPTFTIEGLKVTLHPMQIASVPRSELGEYVKSLRAEGNQIMDSMDELLTQAWG